MENFPDREPGFPVLKITTYPFPKDIVSDLTARCEEILVLEEGFPFIEESLRGLLDNQLKIFGRLDGAVPRDGELNPSIVAKALGINVQPLAKCRISLRTGLRHFARDAAIPIPFWQLLKHLNLSGAKAFFPI
jgi:TPP-dependent indolepyruvate ferredoxin oxidoreductase alpha subunit